MKTFRCSCGNVLYFENTQCVVCGCAVGYLPDRRTMSTMAPAAGEGWCALAADNAIYRMCDHYAHAHVCNWMVSADDPNRHCLSCRLNREIPDLALPHNHALWYRVESAKRRLLYTLYALALPVANAEGGPEHSLAFAFFSNADAPAEFCDLADHRRRVLSGHGHGVIMINIADAGVGEDAGVGVRELYRTLLGHLRHESGHYYWERLVSNGRWLGEFRGLFGDERCDYAEALRRYRETGNRGRWRERHVSAYASVHPREDWAETWAHYLHMVDTLETAADAEVSISGRRLHSPFDASRSTFDEMKEEWVHLTVTMNAMMRSLGFSDPYPFAFSDHATAKLHFVHDVVQAVASRTI